MNTFLSELPEKIIIEPKYFEINENSIIKIDSILALEKERGYFYITLEPDNTMKISEKIYNELKIILMNKKNIIRLDNF